MPSDSQQAAVGKSASRDSILFGFLQHDVFHHLGDGGGISPDSASPTR
jgi:hypothetical protein